MPSRSLARLLSLVLFWLLPAFAVERNSGRYALLLADTAVAARPFSTLAERAGHQQRIAAAQKNLREQLAARHVPVTGSAQSLVNAVFVKATPDRIAEMRALPGVVGVVPLARYHMKLNAAIQLVNAPAAWNALGGVQNAGRGIKIAILDTGIDQNHPAFQDNDLPIPAGFPICGGSDCNFTNRKVIVARSYVAQLAAGSQPNPAADSRPDDTSPRDRVGHGTAVAMVAGGETNTGPAATITGMAPKAYLGNYKVFGSPGVIDFTGGDIIIQALDDAFNDGMDIAVLSLGGPALSGPLDKGTACGGSFAGDPCDLEAVAVENAVKAGMLVVTAAGNEGDTGAQTIPTLNTIDSPADAPSAVAVGAVTNSHEFFSSVRVPGSDAPSNLQQVNALFGDGPLPVTPLTAPVRDVSLVGDSRACSALPAGSLNGVFALISASTCLFSDKVVNAENAGAVGVIMYLTGAEALFSPGGLTNTTIPAVIIGVADGNALRSFLKAHPDHPATLDPSLIEVTGQPLTLLDFSSRGPSTGDSLIKPDLVAVGSDLYLATQSFDPNGELFSANGYTVSNGTSFSTPMVAGAAALVKQKNPGFTTGQLKSALVNTANDTVGDLPNNGPNSTGGGLLDAGAAIAANVSIEPSSLSFGIVNSVSLPLTRQLVITNTGSSPVNLSLSVLALAAASGSQVTLDRQSVSLAAGQSTTVTATLGGSSPAAGAYDGVINITGAAVPLHAPYAYIKGDGIPDTIIPLLGDFFDGTVGKDTPDGAIAIKVIDQFGAPVSGASVSFSATQGGGSIPNADSQTDQFGIAFAEAVLGPQPGPEAFTVKVGRLTYEFDGSARAVPAIADNGIVDAASFAGGAAVAPGSFISIFGTGLSDGTRAAATASLPLNLNLVTVSFDVPSAGISVPGRVYFVSPTQINLQVPWELQGQTSALVKVRINDTLGNVVPLRLTTYAPALFAYTDASGQQAAAVDLNGKLITASNPATRGQTVQLFANGLGPVSNQPQSGDPAPSNPLAQTTPAATVSIGGRPAAVSFSGLAPGFAALYQLNVTVPADAPTGDQPVVVAIGGVSSKTVNLNVR